MMDRLTNTGRNGNVWVINNDYTKKNGKKTSAYRRLAEYEDLEEQGLLMRLPCKVGDVLYVIDGDNIQALKAKNDIALVSGELCIFAENERFSDYVCYRNIGKTVFFTKTEAEQKLKKIKDK